MSKLISVALAATLAFAGVVGAADRGRDGQVNILFWQAPSNVNPYLSCLLYTSPSPRDRG